MPRKSIESPVNTGNRTASAMCPCLLSTQVTRCFSGFMIGICNWRIEKKGHREYCVVSYLLRDQSSSVGYTGELYGPVGSLKSCLFLRIQILSLIVFQILRVVLGSPCILIQILLFLTSPVTLSCPEVTPFFASEGPE